MNATKKKSKKKIIVIALVALIAVGIVSCMLIPRGDVSTLGSILTEPLTKTTLRSTVNTTGTVESADASKVYATVNGIIQKVAVSVGDQVKEGDLLCQFDTESTEMEIAKQEASISSAAAAANLQLKVSQKNYNNAVKDFQDDKNSTLISAKNSVEAARIQLKNAQYAVDHFGESSNDSSASLSDPTGMGIASASTSNLDSYTAELNSWKDAQEDVEEAQKKLDDAKAAGASSKKIADLEDSLKLAKESLERAQDAYDSAKKSYPEAHHQYTQAVDALTQAQTSFDTALGAYDIAWEGTLNSIDSLNDSIESAKLSADNRVSRLALEQLKKQLEDATVTAPSSGTVTAVFATEGAAGSGLLFVIEDTQALKITTTVKEYDLPSIRVGQAVEIKSDGTGENVINGSVTRIAPTAVKAADGSTKAGTNAEFEVEITIDQKHEGLLIGMKARGNIIINEATDVYGVAFDAVLTDADGSSYILVAEANEKGQSIARKVPVQVGMESDFYIEISGEGLSDGMTVITNPAGVAEGSAVMV